MLRQVRIANALTASFDTTGYRRKIMHTIISTATADTDYVLYNRTDTNAVPVIAGKVRVKGGANLAKGRRGQSLQDETPLAGQTVVSNEQLEFLKNDPAFQRHLSRGFLAIIGGTDKVEKVVKNMTPKDRSAPLANTKDERLPAGLKPELISKANG